MENLRKLILENVAIFNRAFPHRFCNVPDIIYAISHDYKFTYGQIENEIEKMVHEGILDAEYSDWCEEIKLI
jgi:hypothetical protein